MKVLVAKIVKNHKNKLRFFSFKITVSMSSPYTSLLDGTDLLPFRPRELMGFHKANNLQTS